MNDDHANVKSSTQNPLTLRLMVHLDAAILSWASAASTESHSSKMQEAMASTAHTNTCKTGHFTEIIT